MRLPAAKNLRPILVRLNRLPVGLAKADSQAGYAKVL
jgi:hypothetical protein